VETPLPDCKAIKILKSLDVKNRKKRKGTPWWAKKKRKKKSKHG